MLVPIRISCQETKPGELVNGGILEQAQLRICDTAARDYLVLGFGLFRRLEKVGGLWYSRNTFGK